MAKEIKDTGKFSLILGCPAEGCRHCIKGEKVVLFITGLCPRRCFYCPVSEKKFGKDDSYADEWKLSNNPEEAKKEMLEECRLINAKGAGITGGDPLAVIDRTVEYIKALKKKFGKKFHVHLYTSLNLANEENLKKLFDAGLDEIRLHPDLNNNELWDKIKAAQKFDWDIGVEIPAVPGYEKQTKKLFDYLNKECRIKFVNLNELEFSDTKSEHYRMDKMNFERINNKSYGVKWSAELAIRLMQHAQRKNQKNHGFSVYFCTAKLKDSVQMRERIKRRAKNAALPFDEISKDGMLIRGVITEESDEDYGNQSLLEKRKVLIKELKLNDKKIVYDETKDRLLMSPKLARKHKNKIKELGLTPAIVAEYPTKDAVEVEKEFL